MEYDFLVDYLTRESLQQCARQDIFIPRPLIKFIMQWLLISRRKDISLGDEDTTTKIYQSIYDQVIANGPVIQMLKLIYSFKNTSIEYEGVQEKYVNMSKQKLIPLLENICSFTGTSKTDLEEIFTKITIYIVASNKMFSTKNLEMVTEAKCALHSILTTQDLLDFVTRKKHYRLEYLDRVGKIMCGILLFNKHMGYGGAEIRDVVNDVQAAYKNTLESVQFNILRCNELITLGLKAISRTVSVNLVDKKLIYTLPTNICTEDLELFNKFNYLHMQHEIYLQEIKQQLNILKNSIDYNIEQLKDTLFKLHDVVKFRLAIPTDLVFPHFTKLFETRNLILVQLYYLVDINKINDEMAAIVATAYPFEDMASKIGLIEPVETSEVSIDHIFNHEDEPSMLTTNKRSDSLFPNTLQRFCALTMALSNGILVQAETVFGVLPFQEQFMAFKRKDYGTFAGRHYKEIVKYFHKTALRNPEMCLFFNIPIDSSDRSIVSNTAISSANSAKYNAKKETFDTGLQTEHCLPPSTLESKLSYSWNTWDHYRRAIQLANLRKCQTHSTQTNITYSSKEVAIQTYDKASR